MRLRGWVRRLARLSLLCCLAVGWQAPRSAWAAVITVTTTAQSPGGSGDCTLGEAIEAAQTDTAVDACPAGGADDTIVLQAGATYSLTAAAYNVNGPSAFAITGTLTLDGQGATLARHSGTPSLRFFYVNGGTLTLKNLTLNGGRIVGVDGPNGVSPNENGQGGGSAYGGAVYNDGAVTLDGVRFVHNFVFGGNGGAGNGTGDGGAGGVAAGGAIWNPGALTIVGTGAVFDSNQALGGLGGAGQPGGHGGPAFGGVLYNAGALTATAPVIFEGNLAAGGLAAGGSQPGRGGNVEGGVIYNGSAITLHGAVFRDNHAQSGPGGHGTSGRGEAGLVFGGVIATSGSGASLALTHSLFEANSATGGEGVPGGSVSGGALFNSLGTQLRLASVRVLNNTATGGNAPAAYAGSGGGVNGHLLVAAGQAAIEQSAIVGNVALTGTSSLTITGGIINAAALFNNGLATFITNTTIASHTASGPALYSQQHLTLTHVTVAHNTHSGGGPAVAGNAGELWLYNSLIAHNAGSNCNTANQAAGSVNLQFPGNSCGLNVAIADPLLGPLTDAGGTPHFPLLVGSPARDGVSSDCAPSDQRGLARPIGAACDLGAIEAWGYLFLPFVRR